ncbi:MAG: class I SAM-dependent methyltransferase [Gaiellaceae bacterium]
MAYFDDEVDPEFEVMRPHGTPVFYRRLIEEKFDRSTEQIRGLLAGSTALTVCGGSGMDAEFLARAGAFAISSDISLGAAQRAADRARRYRLDLVGVVADVEHLPFRGRSVDVVYVHDGLHHLAQPLDGLDEMARVARCAVSVTEPARALATAVAVRTGLALDREESGNRVMRLTTDDVSARLRRAGFEVVAARRYAMLYRHEPGAVSRLLSAPGLLEVSRGTLCALNAVLGGLGNKLTVQAIRP